MENKNNLLSVFPEISKAEWLEKVTKDLKGRALEELNWHLDENITIEAIYHGDDIVQKAQPIVQNRPTNDWLIGEDVLVGNDLKAANAQALDALMNGVEALHFIVETTLSKTQMGTLLAGIELDYIATHFHFNNSSVGLLSVLQNFYELAREQKKPTNSLRGSIDIKSENVDWQSLKNAIDFSTTHLASFKILAIKEQATATTIRDGLAAIIQDANHNFEQLTSLGLSPQKIADVTHLTIGLSCSYFVEIARIRALKLLWANLLKAYEVVPTIPIVTARLRLDSQTDNPHHNMIRSTTQAMSAVLGGVDELVILPANASFETRTDFTRRIARNVQHLLKMESHLDRVVDPSAGSYYVEKLTTTFGTKAWEVFAKV